MVAEKERTEKDGSPKSLARWKRFEEGAVSGSNETLIGINREQFQIAKVRKEWAHLQYHNRSVLTTVFRSGDYTTHSV